MNTTERIVNKQESRVDGGISKQELPVASHPPRSFLLSDLRSSPTNPRKSFDNAYLCELAESLKTNGLLQPIMARPAKEKGKYEIVFGECRFRAANLAGWKSIPGFLKTISDREVMEGQLVENLQRQGLNPFEEAAGYRRLIEEAQYDVERVAERIKKSTSYVYQRLQLDGKLIKPVRDACLKGEITASHAVEMARLTERDQRVALDRCVIHLGSNGDYRVMSVRGLQGWIAKNIKRPLGGTAFRLDDEKLVPKAGSCLACPKRTGFMEGRESPIRPKDSCLDPCCYQAKLDALLKRKRKELAAAQASAGKSGKPLEISTDFYPMNKNVLPKGDWKECKAGDKDAVKALVVDGKGVGQVKTVKRVKKDAAKSSPADERWRWEKRKQEQARKLKIEIRARIARAISGKISKALPHASLQKVGLAFWRSYSSDVKLRAAKVFDWKGKERGSVWHGFDKLAEREVPAMKEGALARFLVVLSMAPDLIVWNYNNDKPKRLLNLAQQYRVDAARIATEVRSEFKARAEKKNKKKAGKSTKKKASKSTQKKAKKKASAR